MIPGAPENKQIRPLPHRDAIHHYNLVQRLGFPQGVRCWCGESFLPTNHMSNLSRERKAFFDQHDECKPKLLNGPEKQK